MRDLTKLEPQGRRAVRLHVGSLGGTRSVRPSDDAPALVRLLDGLRQLDTHKEPAAVSTRWLD